MRSYYRTNTLLFLHFYLPGKLKHGEFGPLSLCTVQVLRTPTYSFGHINGKPGRVITSRESADINRRDAAWAGSKTVL